MIPFEEALTLILQHTWRLPSETVPLTAAWGRVLAETVYADRDIPPFPKSTVDGYAARAADLPGPLRVVGTVPAGHRFPRSLAPGECVRIMTGAPVPEGADVVLMKEEITEHDAEHVRWVGHDAKSNISPQGEDVRAGDRVLPAGCILDAAHVAVLAGVGHVTPRVARRPRVAVLATGTELVPPDGVPLPYQIRNSNSVQLAAQALGCGAEVTDLGQVPDERDNLRNVLQTALSSYDVVLTSGGVSVGDFDFLPEVLAACGMQIVIRRVAMQPGKPMVFAVGAHRACFAFSGNPFSSFLQFELFGKPFLRALMGAEHRPVVIPLPISETRKRKHTERMAWFTVKIEEKKAVPLEYHGSAHIHAIPYADGLTYFPQGVAELAAGTPVPIHLLRCP
jgi:molybdopterin molybdotransferase